jgi:hypothetical protein
MEFKGVKIDQCPKIIFFIFSLSLSITEHKKNMTYKMYANENAGPVLGHT